MENRGAVIFAALLYLIGGTVLMAGSVRRSTVSEPSGEQADTGVPETAFGNPLADSLRAEVAALKKHQRIERGVCAVVSGFTLWRFVK